MLSPGWISRALISSPTSSIDFIGWYFTSSCMYLFLLLHIAHITDTTITAFFLDTQLGSKISSRQVSGCSSGSLRPKKAWASDQNSLAWSHVQRAWNNPSSSWPHIGQ